MTQPRPEPQPETISEAATATDGGELPPLSARVKWFDATRGFGFLISDDVEGDILVHFSVLKEHGRRTLPEGATVTCVATRLDRGYQAKKILSIDLDSAVTVPKPERKSGSRADRTGLAEAAGDFEAVEVKWFNRSKGYGFLNRPQLESEDIFVHMETVRDCGLRELQQGQLIEARIAESPKGLTAVELRQS